MQINQSISLAGESGQARDQLGLAVRLQPVFACDVARRPLAASAVFCASKLCAARPGLGLASMGALLRNSPDLAAHSCIAARRETNAQPKALDFTPRPIMQINSRSRHSNLRPSRPVLWRAGEAARLSLQEAVARPRSHSNPSPRSAFPSANPSCEIDTTASERLD